MKLTEQASKKSSSPIRNKLLAVRSKRQRPRTDTKIVTADNGLMIGGLADAGRILKEPRYIAAAEKAADFVLTKLRTADGRLLRSYAGGEAKLNAYLNDYAFLTDGLIRLHRATNRQRWLDEAAAITAKQIELFSRQSRRRVFLHVQRSRNAAGPRQGARRWCSARRQFRRRAQPDFPRRSQIAAAVFAARRKNHRRDDRRHPKQPGRRSSDDRGDSRVDRGQGKAQP